MAAQDKRPLHQGDARKVVDEKELDKAIEDTFPASDPPAATQGVTGIPDSLKEKREEADPAARKPGK
jgi:hypothetical protein